MNDLPVRKVTIVYNGLAENEVPVADEAVTNAFAYSGQIVQIDSSCEAASTLNGGQRIQQTTIKIEGGATPKEASMIRSELGRSPLGHPCRHFDIFNLPRKK